MASESTHSLERLDADISLLAEVLRTSITELEGERALSLVQSLRDDAIALREGRLEGGRDALAARFRDLPGEDLAVVARAFTQFFQLVNAAEEQHRVRVLRHRDRLDAPVDDSIAEAVVRMRQAGMRADEAATLLGRLFIMPVLTAHPTEARRRTVLEHLAHISEALEELDGRELGERERARLLDGLSQTVVSLLATEESRTQKPSPLDEASTGLAVFERTLLDVTPAVYRVFEDALARAYPDAELKVPPFLRWGSWIGGDRDGNPFVTAEVTRAVFERQRTAVLRRYLHDVEELHRALSVSARRVSHGEGMDELERDLAGERDKLWEVAARARRYHSYEPWREKLWYMRARLQATLSRSDAAYPSAGDYIDDLRLIERTLVACGLPQLAAGLVRDARRRAEVFGFHLASLDVRQHSGLHEQAIDELLAGAGISGYARMDEAERVRVLTGVLERPVFPVPRERGHLSALTRELLATLDVVGRARREMGTESCARYVVSFTSQVSDLLEVLYLIRAARLSPGELRPVPLLEQLEDLDRGAAIAEQMLTLGPLRAAIGDELEVMIGYSDAGKQIGFFASAVALRRAQLAIADVAESHGVLLTIFHGRGGTIGRGGGPSNRAIRAQPERAVRGRLRVTEQGETVTARYGRQEIAQRDLEQMVSAVLVAALDERAPVSADELAARNALFDAAAERAKAAYEDLLADKDLLAAYAVAATPIQQVTKLPIGSRPASRRPGLSFEDLRAIPWVFSWNQSRHGLPGWFGLGTALTALIETHGIERARELYRASPFFRALINNAQLALTRADIDVAEQYSRLADPDARALFEPIRQEHARTIARVLEVVDRQQLLGNRPHLVSTVKRRNPFVDVLSHAQVELLRRLHELEERPDEEEDGGAAREQLLSTLFITINGIAAGLQTAG